MKRTIAIYCLNLLTAQHTTKHTHTHSAYYSNSSKQQRTHINIYSDLMRNGTCHTYLYAKTRMLFAPFSTSAEQWWKNMHTIFLIVFNLCALFIVKARARECARCEKTSYWIWSFVVSRPSIVVEVRLAFEPSTLIHNVMSQKWRLNVMRFIESPFILKNNFLVYFLNDWSILEELWL